MHYNSFSSYQFERSSKNCDGTKELSEGTYFYKIEYTDSQQGEVKSGFVALVR
jgi:hypothetical protein